MPHLVTGGLRRGEETEEAGQAIGKQLAPTADSRTTQASPTTGPNIFSQAEAGSPLLRFIPVASDKLGDKDHLLLLDNSKKPSVQLADGGHN